jgi:methionyl-tRNA formyltransferase
MRIALCVLDSLPTAAPVRDFIARHADRIALVCLSPPFRQARGGLVRQSLGQMARSGSAFSNYLGVSILLPRLAGRRHPMPQVPTMREVCRAHGIAVRTAEDINAPDSIAAIIQSGADLIVSCYFDQIFRRPVLAAARYGAINVHSAPLPLHRGPVPVLYGMLDDPPQLGVAVHRVDAGIDTGAILAAEEMPEAASLTLVGATRVLHARGLALVARLIDDPRFPDLEGRPQAGGSYEGFPTPAVMRAARRCGIRLYDRHDLAAACRTAIAD